MSTKPSTPMPAAELPLVANSQKLLMAGARFNAQAYRAAMRYQIEMFGFLKHRCQEDLKLIDSFVDANEPTGAFDAWRDFMQTAATDYAAEAGKMVSIGSKLSAETASRARRQGEEWTGDGATKSAV